MTVIVFVGGDLETPASVADLPDDATVIAADSGIDHALALGFRIDLAVGDLDSVSERGLAAVEQAGIPIERHPRAKDATDLELALDRAVAMDAEGIVVVGGHGGRFDHTVGNLLVLTSERFAGVDVHARMGGARLTVVRAGPAVELHGEPDSYVTLLAVARPALGVTTTGLRYALAGATLEPGSSRGVSNELVGTTATVEVADGPLVVIQPGAESDETRR